MSLPEPLVPADADLRDYRFMPLHVERLRRSKAWLLAKQQPELGFYMINLWMAAWHECPAASLEDDNLVISDAACCKIRRFLAIKDKLLHGWVKCSDGRLYHPVIADLVNEAINLREKQRLRGAKGALVRWGKHASGMLEASPTHADAMLPDGKGQYSRVYDSKDTPNGVSNYPLNPPAKLGDHFEKKSVGKRSNPRTNGTNPRANGTNPRGPKPEPVDPGLLPKVPWPQRCRSFGNGKRWETDWGPPPGEDGCWAPPDLAAAAVAKRNSRHEPRAAE